MNVTITGDLGAGKSTLARLMRDDGWDVVSAGEIFRREALARGMTVQELTDVCATDPTLDDLIDRQMAEMGEVADHTVFESRLAFHFVPDALKVYLTCPPRVAALRVLYANRQTERYASLEDAEEGLARRQGDERDRFLVTYGVDLHDMSNYDMIIRTEFRTPEEVRDILYGSILLRDSIVGAVPTSYRDEGPWYDGPGDSVVLKEDGGNGWLVEAWPTDGVIYLPDGVTLNLCPEYLEGSVWKAAVAQAYKAEGLRGEDMVLAKLGGRHGRRGATR